MRILDIISESILNEAAALTQKTFYMKDRLENLYKRLSDKENEFLTVNGDMIHIAPKKGELAYILKLLKTNYDGTGVAIDNSQMPKEIGGVALTQLVKTNDLGGRSGVGATGEEEGLGNLGPTVESLKSMAIFAKIIARGDKPISVKEVMAVAKACKKKEEIVSVNKEGKKKTPTSRSVITKQVEDLRQPPQGGIKDKISLTIDVSTASFNRACNVKETDKKAWGALQGIINYVNNESDIGKYSRFFAQNAKRDPVHIQVVGIGGAKTDIKTVYDDGKDRGIDPETGDKIERTLGHMNMSIKAGSDMYDQAPGETTAGTHKLFTILGLSGAEADAAIKQTGFMSKPAYKKGAPPEEKAIVKQRAESVRAMYSVLANDLSNEIANMTDKGEGSFISRVLSNLTNSIKGKGQLVYVNFDAKGNYHKLNPQQIALLAKTVDLGVTIDTTTRTEPHLYVKDMKTGKSIFHVRPAILKAGRITHTFELDHLLDLVKLSVHAQRVQPPATDVATKGTANNASADTTVPASSSTPYKTAHNKMTKKAPDRVMTPSLEIPNMANQALDPNSHLAVAESKNT